jgi:hypothetical protein
MAQKLGLETPKAKILKFIKKWAVRWNLDTSWCIETAYGTVCWWLRNGDRANFSRWAFQGAGAGLTIQLVPEPQDFSFKATWFDWAQDGGTFGRQTEARFKKELRRFIESTIALRKHQGLLPTVQKRQDEHFYWLAQYRMAGLSYADIYRGVTADRAEPKAGHKHRDGSKNLRPEAVQMAITRLAKLIGLELHS